jgi:hypothetical protein
MTENQKKSLIRVGRATINQNRRYVWLEIDAARYFLFAEDLQQLLNAIRDEALINMWSEAKTA